MTGGADGAAPIADRFKLNAAPAPQATVGKGATAAAFSAALVALLAVGALAAMLYLHLDYLKGV